MSAKLTKKQKEKLDDYLSGLSALPVGHSVSIGAILIDTESVSDIQKHIVSANTSAEEPADIHTDSVSDIAHSLAHNGITVLDLSHESVSAEVLAFLDGVAHGQATVRVPGTTEFVTLQPPLGKIVLITSEKTYANSPVLSSAITSVCRLSEPLSV